MSGFLLSGALLPTLAPDDSEMDLATTSESSSSGLPRNDMGALAGKRLDSMTVRH
jgi:hypothetical protein